MRFAILRRCLTQKFAMMVTVLACSWGSASIGRAVDSADVDLAEIRRRLTEWRASFVNVRVIWEVRTLPETSAPVVEWSSPPHAQSGKLFGRQEWIWADHGLDLVEDKFFFHEDGSAQVHNVEAFNAPKGVVFRAHYRKPNDGPEELVDVLLRGLGKGKPTSPMTRTPMIGLYWAGSAQWLPEILPEWKWQFEEVENIGGDPCARISATEPGVTDTGSVDVLWIDLNHDCLVRRYRSAAVARRRAGRDFIIDEFQRLDGAIWFPKLGRIQIGTMGQNGSPGPNRNQIFEVTEAGVNQAIELARFEPPTPSVGTVVDDHGRPYRYGGNAAMADQQANMNTASQYASTAIAANLASAAPPRYERFMWPLVLVAASVIFLVAGVWFSHRRQESFYERD